MVLSFICSVYWFLCALVVLDVVEERGLVGNYGGVNSEQGFSEEGEFFFFFLDFCFLVGVKLSFPWKFCFFSVFVSTKFDAIVSLTSINCEIQTGDRECNA